MQVIQTIEAMQNLALKQRRQGKRLGLVPTMGALHEGHLSLITLCQDRVDTTVVSLFLNPAQFGANEDLTDYPQPLEADLQACEARGADIVFTPTRETIYPETYSTYVQEEDYAQGLCGISRPSHFKGVTTVITILLNICCPEVLVLGEKDAQQVAVIHKMIQDLHCPIEVVTGPTIRESDGLAMSSRNRYLDPTQRPKAAQLYTALMEGKQLVEQGLLSPTRITAEVAHHLSQSPKIRIIYIEAVDPKTMKPVQHIIPDCHRLVAAIWLDQIRLIDNVSL